MNIYVFGNPDHPEDSLAIKAAKLLETKKYFLTQASEGHGNKKTKKQQFKFIFIKPNQDLPFIKKKEVIIMDTVKGISKPTIFTEKDLDKIKLSPRTTVHDFDLGFQLKYLRKLGKLRKLIIIGLPMQNNMSQTSIQSIFKKLVAQLMQGS